MSHIKSPYSRPPTRIDLDNGSKFWVPSVFIDKYPKLIAGRSGCQTLSLSRLSKPAAHVLVHYLFTSTYQNLETSGTSATTKTHDKFATSVEVYMRAEKYGLSGLKDLAKVEIERVGPKVKVTQLIDILEDNCPSPRTDDLWLHNFIKSRINSLLENPPKPTTAKTLSMTNFLFRAMAELYPEKSDPNPSPSSSEAESEGSLKLAKKKKKRQAGNQAGDEARKGKKRKETGLPMSEPILVEK